MRIACSLLAATVVCGFAWLLGFDFNERGPEAFFTAYVACCVFGATYLFPSWKKETA